MKSIAILGIPDHDFSALSSWLGQQGLEPVFTNQRSELLNADGLILYSDQELFTLVEHCQSHNLNEVLDKRLVAGMEVLGVGTAALALFETIESKTASIEGLGQLPGIVQQDEISGEYELRNWELEAIGAFIPPVVTWSTEPATQVSTFIVGPLSGITSSFERDDPSTTQFLRNWLDSVEAR
jgi:glutamine amidotransferase